MIKESSMSNKVKEYLCPICMYSNTKECSLNFMKNKRVFKCTKFKRLNEAERSIAK
jgi:hypothetical protein